MRKVYRGRDIEVSFDLDLCIHVAECLIQLSPVRPRLDQPITKAEDPRGR
ncbi:MAG TPA: (4Fe-4S)-binding protein [Candidatus Dormibacteraeota bacterium]